MSQPVEGRSPMKKAKPFCISKKEVWEAYQRVKANKGAAGVLECTPKMRHEIKGPITLNGGKQCLCPDKSIPAN
jgi:hypothetical protein